MDLTILHIQVEEEVCILNGYKRLANGTYRFAVIEKSHVVVFREILNTI